MKANKIDSLTQAKLRPLRVRRGHPGQLNVAKSFGGRGFAPDPTGEAYSAPPESRPPSWWKNPTPALGPSGLEHVPPNVEDGSTPLLVYTVYTEPVVNFQIQYTVIQKINPLSRLIIKSF